jgi:pimeloyl-ACP methyl ester carboxylesterase
MNTITFTETTEVSDFAASEHDELELREGYANVGDVTLHYVEAGQGPLVLLLHGFPTFWFDWRRQIERLAAEGYRVVAPDLRGYNLSSRPGKVRDYAGEKLADDINGLIHELGADSAMLVGHDWGGTVAWTMAMNHPDAVDKLVILDAAHPRTLQKGLFNPRQFVRSWYFFFFSLPWLPELVVGARNYRFFRRFLRDARPGFTPAEMDRYIEAWSQPGATTGMIDYYRFSVRQSPLKAKAAIKTISAPTLVIWGQKDRYLGQKLAEPSRADVPNLDRVERLPNASHWVHHDEADRVSELMIDFFRN